VSVKASRRKVIVHIGTSADGYIARPDGDLEWPTSRPAPAGFYGMNGLTKTIDTTVLGRKTYEASLRMGRSSTRRVAASSSPGMRHQPRLMGGGELIASFLDEHAIDELVMSVVPVFIGDGIPLIARRHRHVPMDLQSVERFEDGLVQLRYRVQNHA
jgi:dihydrofolate reductase